MLSVRCSRSVAYSAACILTGAGRANFRNSLSALAGGVDIVDYPDSKKIAVAAGIKNADFKTATYVGLGRIEPADYYDGEDG